MNADGFGQIKLSDTPGINWEPAWSAYGEKIAFGNFDFGTSNFEIYEMDADGTDEENLTNAATTEQNPAYSSTRGKLAFTSNRTGNQSDVYLATLDASGVSSATRLTTNPENDYYPAVSPDGKKIAFSSDRDGDSDVYRMRATDGANPVNLTNNQTLDFDPDWQPQP